MAGATAEVEHLHADIEQVCGDRMRLTPVLLDVDRVIERGEVARDDVTPLLDLIADVIARGDTTRLATHLHHASVRLLVAAGDPPDASAHAEERLLTLDWQWHRFQQTDPTEPAPDPAVAGVRALSCPPLDRTKRLALAQAYVTAAHGGPPLTPADADLAWALAVAELGTMVEGWPRDDPSDPEITTFLTAAWTIHTGARTTPSDRDLLNQANRLAPIALEAFGRRHGSDDFRRVALPFSQVRGVGVRLDNYDHMVATFTPEDIIRKGRR